MSIMETIVRGDRPTGAELRRIPVKQLVPNPFRDLDRYPVQRDKIEALRESIRTTGVWPNIVGRPGKGRTIEQAYGHNRRAAIAEELGEDAIIDVLVCEISDDLMMKIMARENAAEWATSAQAEHETIRAVVLAYGEGRITLPTIGAKANKSVIRYAPSFVPDALGPDRAHPYTVETVAAYIGWRGPAGKPQDKVYSALSALQYIEEGLTSTDKFVGLTTKQAEAVIDEAKRARFYRETLAREEDRKAEEARKAAKQAEAEADAEAREIAERAEQHARKQAKQHREEGRKAATKVAGHVAGKLKSGHIGYREARSEAKKIDPRPAKGPPPHINEFARKLADLIGKFARSDDVAERLAELLPWTEHIREHERKELVATLRQAAKRCQDWSDRIEERPVTDVTKMPAQLPAT